MNLLEAIESNKPFSCELEVYGWTGWLLLATEPYLWFKYAECNTWIKHPRFKNILYEGFISSNWVTCDIDEID